MDGKVRAKKQLGQHFLKETRYAEKLAAALQLPEEGRLLEVGPGMGALTQFLPKEALKLVEVDAESVAYLQAHFPIELEQMLQQDFLQMRLDTLFAGKGFSLVGNFPYNISSQIVFKMLDHRHLIPEMAGMFQKEVAQRIAATHGTKTYGILSVLTQVYYRVTYLFDVPPGAFQPPPKVDSAVIRLQAVDPAPEVPYARLKALVKMAFNQRRKTLRNALKAMQIEDLLNAHQMGGQRAEQIDVGTFIALAQAMDQTD